jgi:hypothetical protein
MLTDPYVGKVLLVDLPGTKRPRYRWFVKKREDKRYIVRSPKDGVKISNLTRKRDTDFGKETLLPLGAKPRSNTHTTRKTKKRI